MKKILTALMGTLAVVGVANATIITTADFTLSTADTSTPNASADIETTVANLNDGTSNGTWSGLIRALGPGNTQPQSIAVSDGALTGMTGNFLVFGNRGNTTPFGSEGTASTFATLDLASALSLNGTTISLDMTMIDSGGQPGGLYITGQTAAGVDLFSFVAGNGSALARDLASLTPADAVDQSLNNFWAGNGDSQSVTLNLGAAGYTLGSGGTTVNGSYFAAGDLAKLEFHARDSKADWGLDNLSIMGTAAVPEPASVALFVLGGLALMMRRRK